MMAAVQDGDAKKLAELMRQNHCFDVNMSNGSGTLLHYACLRRDRSPVIPLLLAHPDIVVNMRTKGGYTPFFVACSRGYTSCVREMLKDSRVKVNERDNRGCTPLWAVTINGYLDTIKVWIASGREMDLGTPGDIDKTDAIGGAKENGNTEAARLLERFKENPNETRHAVRVELGFIDELAAEVFALVVFVSDGLLQIKDTTTTTPAARFFNIAFALVIFVSGGLLQINDTTTPSPAARFFSIAVQLPLELQAVLCFRQMGSNKEIIPGKESEVAFKNIVKKL